MKFEEPRKPIVELVADITSQDMQRKQTDTIASFYAIQNLMRMDPSVAAGAVPALVEALATDDPRKAMFVAWALGGIGPAAGDAVPALVKTLEHPWEVKNSKWQFNPRGFAAWALGRIGEKSASAVPVLAKVLHGEDLWARRPAAWALAQLGPKAARATDALVRALAYDSGAAWSAMNNARMHAIEVLERIGKPAVPALVKALSDKRPAVRSGAVRVLIALVSTGVATAPGVVPGLKALLSDSQADVRVLAAEALALAAPDAEVVKRLAAAAEDPDFNVRVGMIDALGLTGIGLTAEQARSVVSTLAAKIRDDRLEVREAAISALGSVGPTATGELLRLLAESKDGWTRVQAARALGSIGLAATRQAVAALDKALADRDAEVRLESALALGRIGRSAAQALPALERAARDGDYRVRAAAEAALLRVRVK